VNVTCLVLAGTLFHAALLMIPVLLCGPGPLGAMLRDPAVLLFLLLVGIFAWADLPTWSRDPPAALGRDSRQADDRLARRLALISCLLLLAAFWTGLIERALAGEVGDGSLGGSQACGALLMFAGVALRAAAVVTLGGCFVTEWRSDPADRLVEDHVYAWVRHPSETGNLAVILGACLLLESRLAGFFVAAFLAATALRIRYEDQRLSAVQGARFDQYARRVSRLIPWLY
jgi:protein-S-isoprenylcysteine O-methyltransferase Ste14